MIEMYKQMLKDRNEEVMQYRQPRKTVPEEEALRNLPNNSSQTNLINQQMLPQFGGQ